MNQIAKLLSKINNSVEREIYIDKISKDYEISKEAIQAEINKLIYSNNVGAKVLQRPVKTKIVEETVQKVDEATIKRKYGNLSFNKLSRK